MVALSQHGGAYALAVRSTPVKPGPQSLAGITLMGHLHPKVFITPPQARCLMGMESLPVKWSWAILCRYIYIFIHSCYPDEVAYGTPQAAWRKRRCLNGATWNSVSLRQRNSTSSGGDGNSNSKVIIIMVAAIYHPPHCLVLITALMKWLCYLHLENTGKLPRVITTGEQENQAWNLAVCIVHPPRPYTRSHFLYLGCLWQWDS